LKASHAEQITTLTETSEQQKEKLTTLRKELEKAEENANKYREQTSTLNNQVTELRSEKASLETSVAAAVEKQAEAELARDKAEGAAKENQAEADLAKASVASQAEESESFATKLATAQAATKAAESNLAAVLAEKNALASVLEAADMQAYLQVRAAAEAAANVTSDYAEYASDITSKYTEIASDIAHDHYEGVWQESERIINKAHPVVVESYNENVAHASDLLAQSSKFIQESMTSATGAVLDTLQQVEPLQPHADYAADYIVMGCAAIPVIIVCLLVAVMLVTTTLKMALLLHKLQFAGVCAMLGAVLAVHVLAALTSQDPLARLLQQPNLNDAVHLVLAAVAVGFSVLHFVTLLTSENGGKSLKAQFASMVAAVLVVVVFAHYYVLVFSKQPVTIQLDYSTSGDPSYSEYSTFFVALFMLTVIGAPASFRLTFQSCFMAIEAAFVGATAVFSLFISAQPDTFGIVVSDSNLQTAVLSASGFLLFILVVRMGRQFGSSFISGVMATIHLAIVARLALVLKRVLMGQKSTSMLKYAAAGFLFLTVVHIIFATFGDARGKATTKESKVSTKVPTKQAASKNHNKKKK